MVVKDYVFCEYEGLKNLASDLNIRESERLLEGYQVYIVEQWVSDRKRPYNTVTVFTGDTSHKAKAWILSVPEDTPNSYDRELERLFESLKTDLARPKNTELGTIMVTNLNTFPPALNTVLVPDGDFEGQKMYFYVNLNLRKVGCSGRGAMLLKKPTDVQQNKFIQLYQIKKSEQITFEGAVLELVTLVQTALLFFGLFPKQHLDGLLCDTTQNALATFKTKFAHILQIRDNALNPNILDPNLVAGLLSLVIIIRNKLNSLGYQVAKDPFSEPDNLITAIELFQKSAKICITRFLDTYTLNEISKISEKERFPDALKVHKVLKSKLEPGLLNQQVDVFTTDIDEFARQVHIERLEYLWRGRVKQSQQADDWFHEGKELGKSILRGVSGRTAKTGDVIRGFKDGVTGSLSNLVDKIPIERDLRRWPGMPKSPSFLPEFSSGRLLNPSSKPKHRKRVKHFQNFPSTRVPHIDDKVDADSVSVFPKSSVHTRDEVSGNVLQRRHSFSIETPSQKKTLRKVKSFADMRAKDELLHIKPVVVDIKTYELYDSLEQREVELKSLKSKLEEVAEMYKEQIKKLADAYEIKQKEYKMTEQSAYAILEKQKSVAMSVKSRVNSSKSNISYKDETLDFKLNEIEEFIVTYCLNIEILESKMPQSSRSEQWLLSFKEFIQRQWFGLVLWHNGQNEVDNGTE
ncbi:6950_t:CDS:10 [Paraglomus brasilianum]|uniref:6950_t:CDS:1 n=1 Tax=Paraglomus brasilianum TaxID=144538 RepID=A0A9N8W4V9_9GLOM|nr:6950_t:CDS:10 [Paraglomus brasilianum]